jgi:hypothetical protein
MSASGTGAIVIIEGRLNGQGYLDLIREQVPAEGRRLCGDNFVFQQDNAPVHTCRIVKEHFTSANIPLLFWPPQSPDLSPIENAWAELKRAIERRRPQNTTALRAVLEEKWHSISPEFCASAVESLPRRCGLVWAQKGGHIGY